MKYLSEIITSHSAYDLQKHLLERMERAFDEKRRNEPGIPEGLNFKTENGRRFLLRLEDMMLDRIESVYFRATRQIIEKLMLADKFFKDSTTNEYIQDRINILNDINEKKYDRYFQSTFKNENENEIRWLNMLKEKKEEIDVEKGVFYVALNNDPLSNDYFDWHIVMFEGGITNEKFKNFILDWALTDMENYFDCHDDDLKKIDLKKIFSQEYISLFEYLKLNMHEKYVDQYNRNILESDNYRWSISYEAKVNVDYDEFFENRDNVDHPAYDTLDEATMDDNGVITYSNSFECDADELDPLDFENDDIHSLAVDKFIELMEDYTYDDSKLPIVFVVDNDAKIEVISAEFDGMEQLIFLENDVLSRKLKGN